MSALASAVIRRSVLLALFCISASAIAAEPTAHPKDAAKSKSSGRGVRQVLVADPTLPHVLLIRDSILSGYHGKAAELLRGKVSLDMWITPKHIGAKDLPTDMKGIFAEQTYDVILFNDIGLHAWTPGRISEGQYEPLMRAHLANLGKFAPKAKLIFASTTPMTTKTKRAVLDLPREQNTSPTAGRQPPQHATPRHGGGCRRAAPAASPGTRQPAGTWALQAG